MGDLVYEDPSPSTKESLEAALGGGDELEIVNALLGAVLYDPDCDWEWCQYKCLELLAHRHRGVRRISVVCLGHTARIFRRLDLAKVLPALEVAAAETHLAGAVKNALDDIDLFIGLPRSRLQRMWNRVRQRLRVF